ncbi:hypothetical protein PCYB_022040 [Plasmodium cynomolgi strain B]|uniref:Uncharacterized protein n=1 Tax=Plasmodium cynomolgi (strain B) TaxID=1120755 RepID=K6UPQ0_PLACD|nr:hypothetical protein PCYB_022040 [Plasmodium cynomolgi strain B]GAB64634.1 hypothetical protein PCYB_022040 [Plasmodium cynomolgi strain B]
MESRHDYEAVNCLISLTKSRSVEMDLKIVKKIHKLIRKNKINSNLNLFDVTENVFASIASIICNKVRIAIYLLRSKKDGSSVEQLPLNEATCGKSPLIDYIRGYDMCSSERCRLTIEYYVKSLSACFTKMDRGDRQTFFANLNNLSMLLTIDLKEADSCSESFQVAVLKYAKNLFLRVYPHDMFKYLDESDITNAQQAVGNSTHHPYGKHKSEEKKKDLDAFFCLTKVIQTVLQNIIKKKKIKLKNLKLLFIILKKINKNVHTLKKWFGAISLNLFLLYRTCHVKDIQKLIRYFALSKQGGHPHGAAGPPGKAQLGELVGEAGDEAGYEAGDKAGKEAEDEAGNEAANEAANEAEDEAGHTRPYNTPIDQPSEEKTIIANVYFICYYMLTNYGDEIVEEISHLCRIIIKYWYLLHKNLVLMGYFVLLSELFSEGGDSFAARLELLLGSRRFAELLDAPRNDPEANCTLERLNKNIGTYYFRHLYNVFMLRRQDEVYLLRFLKGYLFFHFFNSHTDEVPVVREHLSVNYFLSLYETSNVACVNRGTYHPQRDSSTILSEDNSLYSLNVYEQLQVDDRGSYCSGDKSSWTQTRFSHFRNIKDGLKLQDVGLIGDVSILFFLLTNESELENHLNEVLFSTWDNCREGTGRRIKNEELVLTKKWWKEIHHFTNSIDWAKQRKLEEQGICSIPQTDSTKDLTPTGDAHRKGEEEHTLKRKCKCLHFINFYMDALIVMLCTNARVQLEGENKTETTSVMTHIQRMNTTKKQPVSEQALQNDLVKDVLQEYASLYKSYFHLALQIKWSQGTPNLRMTIEKVFLFLTSKRVKKAHHVDVAGEGGHKKGADEVDLRQYYLSLLLICMNKCFCVSSLCGYQDLMEKYLCKDFVFFVKRE